MKSILEVAGFQLAVRAINHWVDRRFSLAYHDSLWVKEKKCLQRTKKDICIYLVYQNKVLPWFHIKAENREPKVTFSLLLDQHVIAVYWLWKSSEGQKRSAAREWESHWGRGVILLNQHGAEFCEWPVNAYQLIHWNLLFQTLTFFIHVLTADTVPYAPTFPVQMNKWFRKYTEMF